MSVANRIFKSAEDKFKKQEKEDQKRKEKEHKENIKIAEKTIQSLPDQIAKSRKRYPHLEWITVCLKANKRISDERVLDVIDYLKTKGFDARQDDNECNTFANSRTPRFIKIRDEKRV